MSATDTSTDRTEALEAKIDRLTQQMEILTADAELRRRQREAFSDFSADLSRVGEGALDVATRELATLNETADLQDTVRLLRRLVEVAPTLERALVAIAQMSELVDDVAPLGTDVMALAVDRLAEADRKGYFAFVRAGAGVADRVVSSFDEDDLAQLGDNVVTILETVKEITQPEMLDFIGQMLDAMRQQQTRVAEEPTEPPSLWALAKSARDPDVRRGIARALSTLKTVSVETGPESDTSAPSQGEQ